MNKLGAKTRRQKDQYRQAGQNRNQGFVSVLIPESRKNRGHDCYQ
jgi:hypothetical protein